MNGKYGVTYQSIFCGEVDEVLPIVPRDTPATPPKSACSKPHHIIRGTRYGPDIVICQSVFLSKVSEILPIIARNSTIRSKPHHSIRITIDGVNKVIRQPVEVSVIFPSPLFERREAEVNTRKRFIFLNLQILSNVFINFCLPFFYSIVLC